MTGRDTIPDFNRDILSRLLPGKKILLVVPPCWGPDMPCLGVHLLQACAFEAGFRVDILYANLLFAALTGLDHYLDISCAIDMKLPGERLFASAAHGLPLQGYNGEYLFSDEHVIGTGKAAEFGQPYLVPRIERRITPAEMNEYALRAGDWAEELGSLLVSFGYEIIGFSSSYEQTNASLALMKALKKYNSRIITLIGGANCKQQLAQGICSLDPPGAYIDFIFSGESEQSFCTFLKNHSLGRLPDRRIIPGESCTALDKLPLPDYRDYFNQLDAFFPDQQHLHEAVFLPLESSRGCTWGNRRPCTFCGLVPEQAGPEPKSPGRIITELKLMKERWGISQFSTTDLLMPPAYLDTLVPELVRAQLNVRIMFEEKAGLSLSQLLALKEAGIISILVGIESFSTPLLKLINKGTTATVNLRLLRYAAVAGMDITWNLLWGFPGDQKAHYETQLALLPLLSHLQPPAAMMHLSLNRFSPYFEQSLDFGITGIAPLAPYYDVFPRESAIDNLAYQFTGDYPCASHEHKELLGELVGRVKNWQESRLSGTPPLLRINKLGDRYLLMDTRAVSGPGTAAVLTPGQARIALTGAGAEDKELLQWALDARVVAPLDGTYAPLALCDSALLQELELSSQ